MKKEVIEDIKQEIKEMREKLEKIEEEKYKLKDSELKIEFDKVINNLYFRIMRLRTLLKAPEDGNFD